MIEDLLRTGAVSVPWSTRLSDGTLLAGQIGINEICTKKCQSHACANERSTLIGTRCHLGLTVYEGRVEEHPIQVFGVVGPQHREALPTHTDFKRACKGRSVTAQEFASWLSQLRELSDVVKRGFDQKLAEALEPLHDAMRLARDVEQLAVTCSPKSVPA